MPVALFVELLSQGALHWRRPLPLLGVILAPLGALGYLSWLQSRFGDFRVFFDSPALLDAAVVRAGHSAGREAVDGRTQQAGLLPPTITPVPSIFLLMDTTMLLVFIIAGSYSDGGCVSATAHLCSWPPYSSPSPESSEPHPIPRGSVPRLHPGQPDSMGAGPQRDQPLLDPRTWLHNLFVRQRLVGGLKLGGEADPRAVGQGTR